MVRHLFNMIFKSVTAVMSIILSVGYGRVLIDELSNIRLNNGSSIYFFSGLIVFVPIWFIWVRKKPFFSTFEHELTHLIAALFFFKKPRKFIVSESGNGATHFSSANFIITLAPYFFPTFAYMLLLVSLIIDIRFSKYLFALIGIVTSYHILSTCKEFRYDQPDIKKSGKIFSTIILVFANILSYGFLIAFINGGFGEGGIFLKRGLQKTQNGIYFISKKYF